MLKRVLRWAYLPSSDPRKDGKDAQRAIVLQVQTLTEQAAKAFAEQVKLAIEAALNAIKDEPRAPAEE